MYTARRGGGAFCNGEPIRVSSQQGEQLVSAPAGGARATAAPCLLPPSCTFPFPDISQSLVLTEMGFRENPEHFKTMLGNIHAILTIPVHGYVYGVTRCLSSPGQMENLISVYHSVCFPPQRSLSGQRRCQHVPGGVRVG